jgi:putative ABC transport system permease protein
MGVPLLGGREFDERDGVHAPSVIVISRSAARQYFGTAQAVGQVIDWHLGPDQVQPVTVIGIVEDILQQSPTDEVYPEVFVDYRQFLSLLDRGQPAPGQNAQQNSQRQNSLAIGWLSFAIRTGGDPAAAVPRVRDIVNDIDGNAGIDSIGPMTRLAANAVARQRFYAVMLGTFAAIATALAAIGIYGVLAFAVIQRTQEIGIRLSLGARRGQVLFLVLRQGLTLTSIGIALGLLGATAVAGLLRGLLFGITPFDAGTFGAVALLFGIVAMAACYLPARRATRIDSIVALRSE